MTEVPTWTLYLMIGLSALSFIGGIAIIVLNKRR